MKTQAEKVYVAIGTDLDEGFSTLHWALTKWSDNVITMVILLASNTIPKDYVYTPIGKLPTSSVNEEKIKVLEKTEEESRDKILSQYIAFCGKIETEVIIIEKNEHQPLQNQIIEIISSFGITKLVMSFGFMKKSSWKSRTAISGMVYVVRQKPDFCEMFVICGGRLVFLRGENNEEGFIENATNMCPGSSNNNDKCDQEIQDYVNELLSFVNDEEIDGANAILKEKFTEQYIPENMDAVDRFMVLKGRIRDVQNTIHLNREQANAAKERREKAEWAISICNIKPKSSIIMPTSSFLAEELEDYLNQEMAKNVVLKKELEKRNEEINELHNEVEQKRSRLNSILELQTELTNKLHVSSSAKARAEAQLEKAVQTRSEMIEEIERVRKQRDILQRRIEFCKEKDALGNVSKSNGLGFDFREFSAAEIVAATQDFSERLRVKSVGRWTDVYRGRINHMTVAVKVYVSANAESQEAFTTKVSHLSQVKHPNILSIIGFCSELNCIVYEYMHNGRLCDTLYPTTHTYKRKNHTLSWHARIRIAADICSALSSLHKSKPKPIIHGDLKSSDILLDRNNIAKINGSKSLWSSYYYEHDVKLDIQAFGNLVLQLLTGNDTMDNNVSLDHSAGPWPVDLAMELCGIATRCLSDDEMVAIPIKEISDVRKRADMMVANGEFMVLGEEGANVVDLSNVPSSFLCPIYQDVMKNPHLAADGFSYEFEAIDEWLKTGHDTSPMTNLRLTHKLLTPNHTLRSLIQDTQTKGPAGKQCIGA
ncbi:hypothetical protein CASFOL_004565 [Castilleja foliolosa]|uniref:RING-type E3 ubiquitin transferase n=1 Tax=Castilleja foliolosa TaxID=1961234 RepID=A0ABD3EAU3_9LAMI